MKHKGVVKWCVEQGFEVDTTQRHLSEGKEEHHTDTRPLNCPTSGSGEWRSKSHTVMAAVVEQEAITKLRYLIAS